MKNMEALSLKELEMVSAGSHIDKRNMGEAAKALLADPLVKRLFCWLKNKH